MLSSRGTTYTRPAIALSAKSMESSLPADATQLRLSCCSGLMLPHGPLCCPGSRAERLTGLLAALYDREPLEGAPEYLQCPHCGGCNIAFGTLAAVCAEWTIP